MNPHAMRAILSLEFVDDTVARSTTREVSMVLTKDEGRSLAEEWIASWNSRDLDRILSHYTDDLEFSSIYLLEFAGEPTGTLKGKRRVGDYWSSALEKNSHLHFELVAVYVGVDTIAIHHRAMSSRDRLELHFLNDQGRIYKAIGHYQS
jgi:hypothetical protein